MQTLHGAGTFYHIKTHTKHYKRFFNTPMLVYLLSSISSAMNEPVGRVSVGMMRAHKGRYDSRQN